MDCNNPFETFKKAAFRLEALPQYIVEDEKQAFKDYLNTGKVSDKSGSEWAVYIKQAITAGKTVQRLRLLSDQLTDYEQYELLAYPGIAYGEDIRVNARSLYRHSYQYDFWLFDNEYITQMQYDSNGVYLGRQTRRATDEEKRMAAYWQRIYDLSSRLG